MQSPPNRSRCSVCRAPLEAGSSFCSACGAQTCDTGVSSELRAVLYLLSELERWQAEGTITRAQAEALRNFYERRREDLRARLTESAAPQHRQDISSRQEQAHAPSNTAAASPSIQFPLSRPAAQPPPSAPETARKRRTIVETLAEPYTLRLLLYTGAAMFVVGIIIWLRDVLYLKLQEPVVQAALLMIGTIILVVSGWLTILRTRQRLTGRALTLAGSLLVPVNFWFLVRSGLITDRGRAWIVWAFCALLYANTAALLRERLYVSLACAASVATGWAIVYRADPNAAALYALVLVCASLLFLHLSRAFRAGVNASAPGRWSRELWSGPLVHAALACAGLGAILYMPLRVGPSPSLYDGILNFRARLYDPGTAILLFTSLAYTAWFTGRYVYAKQRVLFHALCALALLWAQFLLMDGLRLSAGTQVLAMATSALCVSLAARRASSAELARALYVACAFASAMLSPIAFIVLLGTGALTFSESAGFFLLAASFVVLSSPRLSARASQKAFAYLSAILVSTAFLVALGSASLNSVTLYTAACAAWPFVLYALASLARRTRLETQLAAPFERTAGAEFVLLLFWASVVALILYLTRGEAAVLPRAAMFCALFAPLLYGLLRATRERSAFGAGLAAIACLVAVASSLDALRDRNVWPRGWPIAAGVICAAFVLHKAGLVWLRRTKEEGRERPDATILLVTDAAVVLCALLWFSTSVAFLERRGFGAAVVLLLAFVYWSERAARRRAAWAAYVAAVQAGAFFLALVVALNIESRWFAALAALLLVPFFFAAAAAARRRGEAWLAVPASHAAHVSMGVAALVALLEAAPHLRAGDPLLLEPSFALATLACVSFVVSLVGVGKARAGYFRAGLCLSLTAYVLICLRAGFEPLRDLEVYTSPAAVLLLGVAYVSLRREWRDYAGDTRLLFWTGSMLLAGPLLLRALEFRILLDRPAIARDMATLCASLALLLFGVLGRLRAPVLVGAVTLMLELLALALTSVEWLQVPLKIYLVTVGALLAVVGWMFEYRREQLILIRNRLNARRATARERFDEWT